MVVKLPTMARWGKTATLDFGSSFMRRQLPPIHAKKFCIGHFKTMLPLGTIYHLVPHTNTMKGNWASN